MEFRMILKQCIEKRNIILAVISALFFIILFISLFVYIHKNHNTSKDVIEESKMLYNCTAVGTKCLTGHIHQRIYWSDAKNACISKGGQLADFGANDVDFQEIKNAFPEIGIKINDGMPVYLWLNGKKEEESGIWKWSSGIDLPVQDRRWYDDNAYTNGKCLDLLYTRSGLMVLIGSNCDGLSGFLCEYV